ncbi:hypothetical protein LCGC14_1505010 [marine sediment metagenome]|uniref:Uncharacterized protein n=1 Tax=marine sediment metagenome TaxID=412755 RepID=A0A0F9LI93_9ZZZZ
MPRKKKPLREMTKEELVKRLFPSKRLRDRLYEIAHERDEDEPPRRSQESEPPTQSELSI